MCVTSHHKSSFQKNVKKCPPKKNLLLLIIKAALISIIRIACSIMNNNLQWWEKLELVIMDSILISFLFAIFLYCAAVFQAVLPEVVFITGL